MAGSLAWCVCYNLINCLKQFCFRAKTAALSFFIFFRKFHQIPIELPYLTLHRLWILTTFDQPAPASPLAASPISCVNSFRAVKLLVLNLAKCATTMGKTKAKRHPSMQSIPWCGMVRCCSCRWNVGPRWAKHCQTWPNIPSMMLNQPSIGVDHVSKRRGLEAFGFASSLDSTGFAAFLASGEIFWSVALIVSTPLLYLVSACKCQCRA